MKWYIKFLDCLFVSIAVIDFYDSLVLYPAMIIPALSHYVSGLLLFNLPITVATILFALIFPFLWHRQESKGNSDSELRHAWFTGIIRYWLAVEIFNYGFAKILGSQFDPSFYRSESLWNSLSGPDITWNYFSYSYAMSVIIAGIQIAGSAFLLFRRTTLLGVILLLPVMVNIVLIDIFYSLPGGALMNAILFSLGLSYLLLLQWSALKEFIKRTRPNLPAIRLSGIKNIIRLALAVYAFAFIYYVTTTKVPPQLTGKWRVDQLVRNNDTAKENDWQKDSLSWKNIYLEDYGRATFSPNPYLVETERAITCDYKYTESKQTIQFVMHSRASATDTMYAVVNMPDPGHMQWKMVRGKNTVSLMLTKVPEKLHR
ncbi:MAG TPA: hypothetical protein VGZ90_16610 [Puia sp.]|jgi:hypothetical protein|nr:hypothetical protein [Puia sp.]